MAITKLDKGAPEHFLKNGGILIFDEVSDYASASLSTFTNGMTVGDVLQDSTSWDGDEISFESINNEIGEAVISTLTNGTYAYSFNLMSTDAATIKKFLKGADLTISTKPDWMSDAAGVGFGSQLATFETPVGWMNQDLNQILMFPKARVVAGLAYDSGLLVVNVKVTAQKVDTENLKTVMLLKGTFSTGA